MELKLNHKRLFIGVDFDGTIVESNFPVAGPIKQKTVELMKLLHRKGHCIIIWTARAGKDAEFAKNFLIDNNIPFDYFNENPEDPFSGGEEQGRKLHFNILIDDTAVNVADIDKIFQFAADGLI